MKPTANGDQRAVVTSYDYSVQARRTEVSDRRQEAHLRRCPWMKPGDCTCRTDENGRPWNVCIVATCDRPGQACGGYCRPCFDRCMGNAAIYAETPKLDLHYLAHQRRFSDETFGPGARTQGVIDHIRKELVEVEESDGDLTEWADVVILALDGATRAAAAQGRPVEAVLFVVANKQARNEAREWPDWRTCDPQKAIEHVRDNPS